VVISVGKWGSFSRREEKIGGVLEITTNHSFILFPNGWKVVLRDVAENIYGLL
jgi:hypothetical protein